MADEKRKLTRELKILKSEIHSDEGMTYSSTVDISHGGIFISTPEPLKKDSKIELFLKIDVEDEIQVDGIVKWIREDEDDKNKVGMGIEFIDLTDEKTDIIKSLVK
jgi:uncharacterized protein (TIGR02266 family)